MSAWSEAARGQGERIALVPTMGALHAGHLSLLAEGRRRAHRVVLSIFVNPMQFGPQEDLAKYPRDLPGDLTRAASMGCDVAFVPEAASMYGPSFQTAIDVREVSRGLCGECRPGHFVGVATVVCKLFNIVRPHVALFGEKDFQQLAVIRRMGADLNLPVEIVGLPTVREPDGLALSSRNAYLSVADRQRALLQPRAQVVFLHEPVDDHLDRVLELLVERDLVLQQELLAVDLDAREAVATELVEHIGTTAERVAPHRLGQRTAMFDLGTQVVDELHVPGDEVRSIEHDADQRSGRGWHDGDADG